jgi:hypothetical protein
MIKVPPKEGGEWVVDGTNQLAAMGLHQLRCSIIEARKPIIRKAVIASTEYRIRFARLLYTSKYMQIKEPYINDVVSSSFKFAK